MKILTPILALLILTAPTLLLAQTPTTLINLPIDAQPGADGFSGYINLLYGLSISAAALLAVIKIIIAGAKYMLSDVVTTKGAAISEIKGALLGLLLILGAVLILTVINPKLLDATLKFDPQPMPDVSVTPRSVTSTGGPATNLEEGNAAATAAANAAPTGGCNVRTPQVQGNYTGETLDMSGCPEGTDPAPTFAAFANECRAKGGNSSNPTGKLSSCLIPKAGVVKSNYGTVIQQKGVVEWEVEYTTSAKVSTSNRSTLESKCTGEMKGAALLLNPNTLNEKVRCTHPALIGYHNTNSSGLTAQTDCREKKGSLVSGGYLSSAFGLDYDHYCVIK